MHARPSAVLASAALLAFAPAASARDASTLPTVAVVGEAKIVTAVRSTEVAFDLTAVDDGSAAARITSQFRRLGVPIITKRSARPNGASRIVLSFDEGYSPAVQAAIDGARADLAPDVRVSARYVPRESDVDRAFRGAVRDGRRTAEGLARFYGFDLGPDPRVLRGDLEIADRLDAAYIASDDLPYVTPAALHDLPEGPMRVRAQETLAFTGLSAAHAPIVALTPVAPYLGNAKAYFPASVVVAPDRPQVVAIAASTRRQADSLGQSPYAAAAAEAHVRLLTLAKTLGVRTGPPVSFAAFPPADPTFDTTLVATAVGADATGDMDAVWKGARATAAPSTPARSPQTRHAAPQMRAFASPPPAAPAPYEQPLRPPQDGPYFEVTGDLAAASTGASMKRSLDAAIEEALGRTGFLERPPIRRLVLAIALPPYANDSTSPKVHAPVELWFEKR